MAVRALPEVAEEEDRMGVTATRGERTAQELAAADRQRIIHPYLPSSTEQRVVMVCLLYTSPSPRD